MNNDEKIRNTFGKVLRRKRHAVGKTQETLALDIGFDRGYISSLERGVYGPTLTALFSLAQGLGISLSELVAEFELELNKECD